VEDTKRALGAAPCAFHARQMGDSERDGRSTPEPLESHTHGAQAPCSLPPINKKVARGMTDFCLLAEAVSVEFSYKKTMVIGGYPRFYPCYCLSQKTGSEVAKLTIDQCSHSAAWNEVAPT